MAEPEASNALYPFPTLLQTLEATGIHPIEPLRWLEASYRQPDAFWVALTDHHRTRGVSPSVSTPFLSYRLYQDLVFRHAGTDLVAFRWWDRGWRELSYRELHQRAVARAADWARRGVEAGQVVCAVFPPGPELLVAFAAACRLGAVFSWLPPDGPRFLERRLEALGPDRIVTSEVYASLFFEGAETLLLWASLPLEASSAADVDADVDRTHTYETGEVAALLFSPVDEEPAVPRPLSVDGLYLHAVRDAHLAFRLRPGDNLAAPGAHGLQHHPALLAATLCAGACFIQLELQDIAEAPEILGAHPMRSIGLCAALREVLLQADPLPRVAWYHWFRDPQEPIASERWNQLLARLDLREVSTSNLVIDAASGGCLLFSVRRGTDLAPVVVRNAGIPLVQRVLVPAGMPFELTDPTGRGQPALGATGVLRPLTPDPLPTYLMVGRDRSELNYLRPWKPRRSGRTYPRAEVTEALADMSFVRGFSVVSLQSGPDYRFVLLGFTGPVDGFADREDGWERTLRQAIRTRLGPDLLPDRIELFPLYPRRTGDGVVDDRWCARQYLRGSLHRKAGSQLFQTLTDLRRLALEGART